jgi:branched-chain amino acid transport system permease protein
VLIQQLSNGLALGMVYALVAVGYSLVFGVLRILNMAHSAIYALGAHIIFICIVMQWGIVPGLIISMIVCGLVDVFLNTAILSPLRLKQQNDDAPSLIAAIGFSYVILNLVLVVFGSNRKSFPNLFDYGIWKVGGLQFLTSQVIIFGVSMALLVGLTLIVNYTKFGLGMRAVQQNIKAANLMGVNVRHIISVTFFLSGVLACLAGFLIAGYYQLVYPIMGVAVGNKAFAAAVLGGIGVLYGCIIGGLIVGITECFAVSFLGGGYRDAVAFVILIIALLFRPNGLFGKKDIVKV